MALFSLYSITTAQYYVKTVSSTDFSSYSLHHVIGQNLRDNISTYGNNSNDWFYGLFWIDNNDGTLLDYEIDDGTAAPIPRRNFH